MLYRLPGIFDFRMKSAFRILLQGSESQFLRICSSTATRSKSIFFFKESTISLLSAFDISRCRSKVSIRGMESATFNCLNMGNILCAMRDIVCASSKFRSNSTISDFVSDTNESRTRFMLSSSFPVNCRIPVREKRDSDFCVSFFSRMDPVLKTFANFSIPEGFSINAEKPASL